MQGRERRRGKRPSLQDIHRAGVLCCEDALTDEEIARELGIARRTLARWKHHPTFQAAWQEELEHFRAELRRQLEEEDRQESSTRR